MRFRTVSLNGQPATVVVLDGGYGVLDRGLAIDESMRAGALATIDWAAPTVGDLEMMSSENVRIEPIVRRPRKLWGIGLNYAEHAGDLAETAPTEPASFIKGDHTLIGADDSIVIPEGSTRTTAEAELGLVIGRLAYQVDRAEALNYVAGVCLVLDQTEEEILRRNPRFLTRSKNYPSFLSLGPDLVTLDEALSGVGGDINALTVETRINGELHRANQVRNMTFPPDYLIEFHSQLMPLFPGDVILTGTPGAVVISAGDVAECRIDGVGVLINPVIASTDPTSTTQLEPVLG